jgi:hypothetical protein
VLLLKMPLLLLLPLLPFCAGRWYGGNVLMPDGTSYVTGGDLGPGSPRALGEQQHAVLSWE